RSSTADRRAPSPATRARRSDPRIRRGTPRRCRRAWRHWDTWQGGAGHSGRLGAGRSARRPWLLALLFGIPHGQRFDPRAPEPNRTSKGRLDPRHLDLRREVLLRATPARFAQLSPPVLVPKECDNGAEHGIVISKRDEDSGFLRCLPARAG